LINHRFYDLAYYAWLQFLPPEQLAEAGHLFNGSFEVMPSRVPFDWYLPKRVSGETVEIAALNENPGQHALLLTFGAGRVDYHNVSQTVVLQPGSYKFRGRFKADLVSERGLRWIITCAAGQSSTIGQSQAVTGSTTSWSDFEFSFAVPNENCPAQYVSLSFDARSASEQFITGFIWYDDLKIVREAMAKAQ
jgi:hypothetical protein